MPPPARSGCYATQHGLLDGADGASATPGHLLLIIWVFWPKNLPKLHNFQPAGLVTSDVTASPLRFWCKKRSKRSTPKSLFFRVRR